MTRPEHSYSQRALLGSPWCLRWRGGRYWFGVRVGRFSRGLRPHSASTRRLCIHWGIYGGGTRS